MKRARKIIFNLLLGLSVLGIPVFTFGIINTMVSLKYETNNPTDCISSVTGQDLCLTIQILKALIVACFVIIILLLAFRKRILKLK
jgi:ABC-type Mn2+/Zn2+ transport system permease subunit